MSIVDAIEHFKYGISHDIFKEPVISYAKMAVEALEKQIPIKVKYKNRHGEGYDLLNEDYYNCPACGRRLRNKQKDKHCGRCGQTLEWI